MAAKKYKYLNVVIFFFSFEVTIVANKPAIRITEKPKVEISPPNVSVNEDINYVFRERIIRGGIR